MKIGTRVRFGTWQGLLGRCGTVVRFYDGEGQVDVRLDRDFGSGEPGRSDTHRVTRERIPTWALIELSAVDEIARLNDPNCDP